jgi:hypothetical protein
MLSDRSLPAKMARSSMAAMPQQNVAVAMNF